MVWHSPDGTDWSPMAFDNEATCTEVAITDVAPTTQGFLAVGRCDARAGFWVSDTGADWQLISTHHPVFTGEPQLILSNEEAVVVIGSEGIWTTTPIP